MRHASVVIAAAALAVLAPLCAASVQGQEETGRYRTALSAVGGLSVGSSRRFDLRGRRGGFDGDDGSGFAVGGSLAHDLSSRITLEATGLYLDHGSSAWSADAGLRLNLEPAGRSLVPYFAVSGGVYGERSQRPAGLATGESHQDHDRDRRGPNGRHAPSTFRPGPASRPLENAITRSRRTDGMVTLGGGVQFAAGEHVFVRPDARAQVVFSDTRVLGLFTLNFGYRF